METTNDIVRTGNTKILVLRKNSVVKIILPMKNNENNIIITIAILSHLFRVLSEILFNHL